MALGCQAATPAFTESCGRKPNHPCTLLSTRELPRFPKQSASQVTTMACGAKLFFADLLSTSFGRGRIDHAAYPRHAIRRETALPCVCAHGGLARGDIEAVDLVVSDEALEPVNLRPHALQHAARLLRDRLQFVLGSLPAPGFRARSRILALSSPLLSLMTAQDALSRVEDDDLP